MQPNDDIDSLMERYQAGDEDAFDELYRQVAPKLLRFLHRRTRSEDRAEDLLQATFAKVHRSRASYDPSQGASRWLTAIARNTLYDDWRRREVRKEDLTSTGAVPEPILVNPSEALGSALTVRRAVALLPTKLREAIELTFWRGLTSAEAADEIGTSRSNVKVRAHRGYQILRASLAEQ